MMVLPRETPELRMMPARPPTRWFALLIACATAGAPAAPPGFPATAHQVLHRVTRLEDSDHGLAYASQKALLDTCNELRHAFYELPPSTIDEAVLRRLDEQRIEKFFGADRALQLISGQGMRLPDFQRWTAEQRAGQAKPAVPPDCGRYQLTERRTGTLWRDGLRYQLDFTNRRVLGQAAPADFTPRPLMALGQFELQPEERVGGQPCRRVAAPGNGIMDGRSCAWSGAPFVAWLNWPWVLEGESRFGLPQKLVQRDTLESMETGGSLPPGIFDLPKGFEVRAPARSAPAAPRAPLH